MPVCKNCGNRIEKFNNDRCPICGQIDPFSEKATSETIEVTTSIDVENEDYKPRHKKTMLILFLTLGFFGVPFFYIYQKKSGLIFALINIIGIGLISFLFAFYAHLPIWAAILSGFAMLFAVNAGTGLYLYFLPNLQDGRGDFIV